MEQSNTQTGNSNKLVTAIAVILGIVVMVVTFMQFSKFSGSEKKEPKEVVDVDSVEKIRETGYQDSYTDNSVFLTQAANDVNKSCPFMVDKETRLDNAMAMPNNTLQYNYTLVNTVEGSVDPETMKSYIRPTLLNMIRSNPELRIFRDNKTSFAYSYNDMNGVFLFKLLFTPDQYQ